MLASLVSSTLSQIFMHTKMPRITGLHDANIAQVGYSGMCATLLSAMIFGFGATVPQPWYDPIQALKVSDQYTSNASGRKKYADTTLAVDVCIPARLRSSCIFVQSQCRLGLAAYFRNREEKSYPFGSHWIYRRCIDLLRRDIPCSRSSVPTCYTELGYWQGRVRCATRYH